MAVAVVLVAGVTREGKGDTRRESTMVSVGLRMGVVVGCDGGVVGVGGCCFAVAEVVVAIVRVLVAVILCLRALTTTVAVVFDCLRSAVACGLRFDCGP